MGSELVTEYKKGALVLSVTMLCVPGDGAPNLVPRGKEF